MEPNTGATAFWISLMTDKLPTRDPQRLAEAYRIKPEWVAAWIAAWGR